MDLQTIIQLIQGTATFLDIHPTEVTRKQLKDYALETHGLTISNYALHKNGTLSSIKNTYFEKDLNHTTISATKEIRKQQNKINKLDGDVHMFMDEISHMVKEKFATDVARLKPYKVKKEKHDFKRAVHVHISDTHAGQNITKEEMHGVNEFNWGVLTERLNTLLHEIITYKEGYRNNTELHVSLNGDILAGIIHDQEWVVDLISTQFVGMSTLLTQFFTTLVEFYPSVTVYCTSGNHGRFIHKSNKDRALTKKWDNFEYMLFHALDMAFKMCSTIEFHYPKSPYIIFNILGHSYFQTHGDTVLDVGYPGRSVDVASLNQKVEKLNSSGLHSKPFDCVLIGHTHRPLIHPLDCGTMLMVNGCVPGVDEYAQSKNIWANVPAQIIFEITPFFPVGDMRIVYLNNPKKDINNILQTPFKE